MTSEHVRLVELEPKWTGPLRWASPSIFITGITFLCPHCKATRLSCNFTNPIDPDEWCARTGWEPTGRHWQRTGESYETLTLEPSIDNSLFGHWHGRVTNGEMTGA